MSLRRPLALLLLASALIVPSAAGSGTGAIVIGQLYASGGNAGAAFTHDYVELFNRGTSAVSLSGWSLQYATAAGTSWSVTAARPGRSPPAGRTSCISPPARTAPRRPPRTRPGRRTWPPRAGRSRSSATPPRSRAAPPPAAARASPPSRTSSATARRATTRAAAPRPAPGATTALIRAGNGCTDADQNGSDLATAAAAPRNSASGLRPCTIVEPPPSGGVSADASVAVEIESVDLDLARADVARLRPDAPPARRPRRSASASRSSTTTRPGTRSPSGAASSLRPTCRWRCRRPRRPAACSRRRSPEAHSWASRRRPPRRSRSGRRRRPARPAATTGRRTSGFLSPFPNAASGRYTATLTFTVIGR